MILLCYNSFSLPSGLRWGLGIFLIYFYFGLCILYCYIQFGNLFYAPFLIALLLFCLYSNSCLSQTCKTIFLSLFSLSSTNWCIKMMCTVLILKLQQSWNMMNEEILYCLHKMFWTAYFFIYSLLQHAQYGSLCFGFFYVAA